jgi:multisubunit Na+/H+ antiporter MnhG subunit
VRLNAKDLAGAILLMAFAIVGFWINAEDHAIGTARRMGPGYMPMLAFGILAALAALTFVIGLFNGPDPLERWTQAELLSVLGGIATAIAVTWILLLQPGVISRNWYPLGLGLLAGCLVFAVPPRWRKLGLVTAGMVVFGLVLEIGGLFLAIALCIGIAALPDETQTVKGTIGLILFQIALCWFVFIRQLDIRVSIWPQF